MFFPSSSQLRRLHQAPPCCFLSIHSSSTSFPCSPQNFSKGTYLLFFEILSPLKASIGRFNHGRPLSFAPGDYLYLGSAMGKAATSLPRRTIRHCLRHEGPAHPLFKILISFFAPLIPHPSFSKRLHWHIDYLLELPQVKLWAILLLATPQRLESSLSLALNRFLSLSPLQEGLGASDLQHTTNILLVQSPSRFWQELLSLILQFC